MKLIQLISHSINRGISDERIYKSTFKDLRSVDDFAINIFDFNDEEFWKSNDDKYNNVTSSSDLRHVATNIKSSSSSPKMIIIIMPQNLKMKYHVFQGKYRRTIELKNMLVEMRGILKPFSSDFHYRSLEFALTTTQFYSEEVKADFYFSSREDNNILTKSKSSQKATTVKFSDDIIVTTLNLNSVTKLFEFLKYTKVLSENKSEVPDWFGEIQILDDAKQEELIKLNIERIESFQKEIEDSREVLEVNNKYKSILYETGEILVEIIYEMLTDMLNIDSEISADLYDEDFFIKYGNITFIGEIKGVSKNVKKENVAQLDTHYQKYMDKLEESEELSKENVKALLIINYQRKTSPDKRDIIPLAQIDVAKRNGSLIIDTYTFLKMYEKYKCNEINNEEVVRLLTTTTGLLKI